MTNQIQNSNSRKYNLEERTAKFGEQIIEFCKKLIQNSINKSLISQLIRSATSVGANYMEADVAESKKDFRYKIGCVKKNLRKALTG